MTDVEFTFSDLKRRSGDGMDAALAEPVRLMERAQAKIVVLPLQQYASEFAGNRLHQRTT